NWKEAHATPKQPQTDETLWSVQNVPNNTPESHRYSSPEPYSSGRPLPFRGHPGCEHLRGSRNPCRVLDVKINVLRRCPLVTIDCVDTGGQLSPGQHNRSDVVRVDQLLRHPRRFSRGDLSVHQRLDP